MSYGPTMLLLQRHCDFLFVKVNNFTLKICYRSTQEARVPENITNPTCKVMYVLQAPRPKWDQTLTYIFETPINKNIIIMLYMICM